MRRRPLRTRGLLFAAPLLVPLLVAGQVAACANRFLDDDGSVFENDIARLAAAGITKGCNPPTNDEYCPDDPVTRGQMAAFLTRALDLDTPATNHFVDDDGSVFENDIARLAAAGITKGCNPPTNDEYCPDDPVTRGQMAAFLTRALDLPDPAPFDDPRQVTAILGDTERLAADRGVTVTVLSDGCRLRHVDRQTPEATFTAPAGDLQLAYVTPGGHSTDVTWTATPADDGTLPVEQPWRRPPPAGFETAVLAWQANGERSEYRSQLDAAPLVDVVSPIWWRVRSDGTVASFVDAGYVQDVHDRGKQIWPAVAGFGPGPTHALLSDPAKMAAAVEEITSEARSVGADGVNIDLEGVLDGDADELTAFISEVADAVHSWDGIVSYDMRPRFDVLEGIDPAVAHWETAPQRREISELVDFTMLMTYDEFHRLRPGGPVASPEWVEDTLVYQLRYSDPHTVMLGIPFYGRVWDPDDLDSPQAVTMGTLERLASAGTTTFDEEYGLDRVLLDDGRYLYREDSELIADRLGLTDDYRLAGWAAWRLGFDSPSLWTAIGG